MAIHEIARVPHDEPRLDRRQQIGSPTTGRRILRVEADLTSVSEEAQLQIDRDLEPAVAATTQSQSSNDPLDNSSLKRTERRAYPFVTDSETTAGKFTVTVQRSTIPQPLLAERSAMSNDERARRLDELAELVVDPGWLDRSALEDLEQHEDDRR